MSPEDKRRALMERARKRAQQRKQETQNKPREQAVWETIERTVPDQDTSDDW